MLATHCLLLLLAPIFSRLAGAVNEHAPTISVNALGKDATVRENAPAGTFVAMVSAEDADPGQDGRVMCSQGEPWPFRLESLSPGFYKLLTARSLDREAVERYDVVITCRDLGQPPRSSTASVRVRVEDENDHAPQFSQPTYVFIIDADLPPGTLVGRVIATDRDIGQNGALVYTWDNSAGCAQDELFLLDRHSGNIVTTTALSGAEGVQDTHACAVRARDGGSPPRTATVAVTIQVNNLTNTARAVPVFAHEFYVFAVFENEAVGTAIGQLQAVYDDRLEAETDIQYSLESPHPAEVRIDPLSGLLSTAAELDREQVDRLDFYVKASNPANTSAASTAHVLVFLVDRNDNAPEIYFPTPTNSTVTLQAAGSAPGQVVAQVWAGDRDLGVNALLTYQLFEHEEKPFLLDWKTGVLTLRDSIQGSAPTQYELVIAVYDAGMPRLSTMAVLHVNLTQ